MRRECEVGISTGFFYEEDILDALPLIEQSGFRWIELWAGPHKWYGNYPHFDWHDPARVNAVEREMRRLGLKPWSLHAPYSAELDVSDPEEKARKAAVAEVRGSMQIAARLGVPYVVYHPSSQEFDLNDEDEKYRRIAALRKSSGELVKHAQSLGLTVAIENLLPHLMGGDPKVLLEVLTIYAARGLAACFDSSHANCWKDYTAVEILHKIARYVETVHLSDNFGDHDDHFAFGRGTADWKGIAAALRRAGYKGVYLCEMHGEALDGDPLHKLKLIHRRAQEVLCGVSKP